MSDQMEDDAMKALHAALLRARMKHMDPKMALAVSVAAADEVQDILADLAHAGYRIVKPDGDKTQMSLCVNSLVDEGYQIEFSEGRRRDVVAAMVAAIPADDDLGENETVVAYEAVYVPISRASLLAELESMKEAGE